MTTAKYSLKAAAVHLRRSSTPPDRPPAALPPRLQGDRDARRTPLAVGRWLTIPDAGLGLWAQYKIRKSRPCPTPSATTRTCGRIFQQHCQGCHQPAKAQGGYVMTSHADLLKKGDHDEPGIVPGKPDTEHPRPSRSLPHDGKPPACRKRQGSAHRRRSQPDQALDRARGQGRHARRRTRDRHRHGAPAGLQSAARSSPPSPTRPTATCSPSPAITKSCCTRPTAAAWSARLVGLSERIQALAFSPDGK